MHSESGHYSHRFFREEIDNIKEHGLHTYNILENPNYRELILNLNTAAEAVKKFKVISKGDSEIDYKDALLDNKSKINSEIALLDSRIKGINKFDYKNELLDKSKANSENDCKDELLDSKNIDL